MEKKKAFMKIRFMVYQDGTGNLWIATENGLFRLLVDSDTFVSYGKSDGILDKIMIHIHCIFHHVINACIAGKIMDCVK